MIEIRLVFYAGLAEFIKDYKKEEQIIIKLEKSESIRNIIARFIPLEQLSRIGLILVNKKFVNLDYMVQDKDKIKILPVLHGG